MLTGQEYQDRVAWLRANRRMTDAALGVARWVELHAAGVDRQPELKARLDEFRSARAEVVDRIAADQAPAPKPVRHLRLVR
jgi:hypothetical protein